MVNFTTVLFIFIAIVPGPQTGKLEPPSLRQSRSEVLNQSSKIPELLGRRQG